jgi:cyanate permease
VLFFAVAFPVLFAFFYDARDLARRGQGRDSVAASDRSEAHQHDGLTAAEAIRSPGFWLLAVSSMTGGGAVTSVAIHLIPLLQDRGLDPMHAAAGMSIASVTAVIGRLGSGYSLDRIPAAVIAGAAFCLPILGCLMLLTMAINTSLAFVASAMIGLSLGVTLNLLPYVTARCFGLKAYGTIYGLIQTAFIVGGAMFPPLLGQLYEWQGSYSAALVVLATAFLLCAAALQFIKVPARTPAVASSTA